MSNASDFTVQGGVLKKYTGPGGDVVIPETVTSIGDSVFFFSPGIKHITIPETVKSIGKTAFYRCTGLESIEIPKKVTVISTGAFSYCTSMTTVMLPEGVSSIGEEAFRFCKKLTGLEIPESVREIGREAFYGCGQITEVRIPRSVTAIGNDAFSMCENLREVTIEADRISGVKQAFPDNGEIFFRIPRLSLLSEQQRVRSVELFAEKNGEIDEPYRSVYCKHIKNKADKYIKSAMEKPELLDLMCREKLLSEEAAQAYLETAQGSGNSRAAELLRHYITNMAPAEKKAKKKTKTKTDTAPKQKPPRPETDGIEGLTFAVTGNLETFEKRAQLKDFLLAKGAKLASSVSAKVDYLIMNDPDSGTEKRILAEELGIQIITEQAFNKLAGRVFDISPDNVLVRYTGTDVDVVIPEGVTGIGAVAFCSHNDMKTLEIPDSVTSIGNSAFCVCENLERIRIPEGVTSIGVTAFFGCEKITEIAIPAGVTQLERGVFENCRNLKQVTLPAGLTAIGEEAFRRCASLECICIPETVTSIGSGAFKDCESLNTVTLPKNLRSIPKDVFDEGAKILFLVEKFSLLTLPQRRESMVAFAEKNGDCPEPYRSAYRKHIKSKAADYMEAAMQHSALLELMHRENLIPAKEAEDYLEAAQRSGKTEAIALMMDYITNHLTLSEKEKVEKQKEATEEAVFERKLQRQGKTGIEGLTFVTTTKLETFENRSQLKELIAELGGTLTTAVTARVDYLIMNEKSPDGEKKERAEELGIEIITERQFNEMAGRRFIISSQRVLQKYIGNGGDVVIPEGVTAIDKTAFLWCRDLTGVVISERVTSIGDNAFRGCCNLTAVVIPEKVTRLGEGAFSRCTALKRIVVPKSVRTIGYGCFEDCTGLEEVILSEGLKNLHDGLFSGCAGLTHIHIPGSVTFIGPDAFTKHYGYKAPLILKPTFHAPAGSYAEKYAQKHNIPFVAE